MHSTILSSTQEALNLKDLVQGGKRKRRVFSSELTKRLSESGYFYLNTSELNSNTYYNPSHFYDTSLELFNKTLAEKDFLTQHLLASGVFQNGYNAAYFPKSKIIKQLIESFLWKPEMQKTLRSNDLPSNIRNFVNDIDNVYKRIYNISLELFSALETEYELTPNTLAKILIENQYSSMKTEGAVRFVRYHSPVRLTQENTDKIYVSEPHVDESFFTFGLGETSTGLVCIDGVSEALLAGTTREHLLITTGFFSHNLTKSMKKPIRAFKHNVQNTEERLVGLAFIAPESGLHYIPVNEWPSIIRA